MAFDWDFFLAHAGADLSQAEELYGHLKDHARVFLDSRVLLLGDSWDVKLAKAQQASLITLVLVSAKTEKAYYQREEIAAAIAMAREDETKHRVIPIYLDDPDQPNTYVPYGLRLRHGIRLSETISLRSTADELLEQLPKIKASIGGNVPSSSAAPPGTKDGESLARRMLPGYSFEAVNPAMVRRVWFQSLVVLGLAVLARIVWSQPSLIAAAGLNVGNAEVPDVLNRALWYGIAGILALVLLNWMNTQIVFSLSRVLLFVSVLALMCAALRCVPGVSPWIHGVLLSAFVLAGALYYFGFGIARYYLKMRSYGDVAAEGLIFLSFIYFMRRPLMMLFGG